MQVRDGGVEVLDVQGDMAAADVAVARGLPPLVGRLVLEDLEDRLAVQPVEVSREIEFVRRELTDHPARGSDLQ